MISEETDFITSMKFAMMVENMVHNTNAGYIESVLKICEDNSIDTMDASRLISTPLKSKIEAEAVEFNYIKSDSNSRLPV
jgi:hypothetical protein|tara:strand:- start:2362 stop:2601 length:240 start_codon:yes stop_codon:yes gene_type:complete